jgi:tribbles-like protein
MNKHKRNYDDDSESRHSLASKSNVHRKKRKLSVNVSAAKNVLQPVSGSAPSTPTSGHLTPSLVNDGNHPEADTSEEALARPTTQENVATVVQPTEERTEIQVQAQKLSKLKETSEEQIQQSGKNLKIIAGKYQILHTTDEEEPTHIVSHLQSGDFALCREVKKDLYVHYMDVYERLSESRFDDNDKILQKIWPYPMELFMTDEKKCYHVAPRHYGTLHSYVIDKKKLNERETKHYYRQILEIVAYCHVRGIVVRDVKLRKFVFVDENRRRLRLDDLDELMVCKNSDDDSMSDRHGCPAYVSPEILDLTTKDYAGKSADVWGLGVLLYVLLMGRYPFYDTTPSGLFGKIRTAKIVMSEQCGVTLELRWLIRCLLRKLPEERPKVSEIVAHPWLANVRAGSKFKIDEIDDEMDEIVPISNSKSSSLPSLLDDSTKDQCVPCLEPMILSNRQKRADVVRDQEMESIFLYRGSMS